MTDNSDNKPLIFRNALAAFERYWKTVLGTAVLMTLAAGLYALLADPVFEAEVTMIALDEEDASSASMPSGLASIAAGAGVSLESNNYLRVVSMATLESKSFIQSFIESEKLMPTLFADQWDATEENWQDASPTFNDAFELFDEDIMAVSQDFQTGLTTLSIRWHDPDTAAYWANELVYALNVEMRQRAITEAEESIAYLEMERDLTSVIGVQQAIHDLIETQLNRKMQANVRNEYAFRVIDPATAPDADDPIFPKFLLLLCAGLVFGLMLGTGIALLRDFAGIRQDVPQAA
ncbi:MAG: GNVR domain-containing protein [Woeseiaceae bacterium]